MLLQRGQTQYQDTIANIERTLSVAQSRGDFPLVQALTQQDINSLNDYINWLSGESQKYAAAGLTDKSRDIDRTIKELQGRVVDLTTQLLTNAISEIDRASQRRSTFLELRRTVAKFFGQDTTAIFTDTIAGDLTDIAGYLDQLSKAGGNQTLIDDLIQKIAGKQTDIFTAISQQFTDFLTAIDDSAQSATFAQDAMSHILDVQAQMGGPFDANYAGRGNALAAKGAILQGTQASLLALQQSAIATGMSPTSDLMKDLTKRIMDNTLAIVDNTQAQWENLKAAVQAKVDVFNKGADFTNTVNSIMQQIAQLSGPNFMPDQGSLISLTQQHGTDLTAQRAGIQELIAQAQAVPNNTDAVNALTIQLLQNQLAILENNKSLAELRGTMDIQSFTSRAWQWFRKAVFDGMGGLLTPYKIPGDIQPAFQSLQGGGTITKSGLFHLHAGEAVTHVSDSAGDTHVTVNVDHPMEVADPIYFGRRIAWDIKTSR
jgi:hypothetical protein